MLRALQLEPSHQRILVWVGLHSHEFVTVIANAAEEHYCSALAATVCHAVCCLPLHRPTLGSRGKQNDIKLKLSDSQSGPSSASLSVEHWISNAICGCSQPSLQAKQVLSVSEIR